LSLAASKNCVASSERNPRFQSGARAAFVGESTRAV
jgi:hypothetical protein